MKVAVASDHAGFEYKNRIFAFLQEKGYEAKDFGTYSKDSCSYVDWVVPAAKAVAQGEYDRAIVLGGSGNGEAMASNKVHTVRCGLAWDLRSAKLCRLHNNANVLALGQRMMSIEECLEIVELWLTTEYEGGRHDDRVNALDTIS